MAKDDPLKKLPPKDLLITRPDEPLDTPQEIKRPDCTPGDPKEKPEKGQAYDNYAKGIAYIA